MNQAVTGYAQTAREETSKERVKRLLPTIKYCPDCSKKTAMYSTTYESYDQFCTICGKPLEEKLQDVYLILSTSPSFLYDIKHEIKEELLQELKKEKQDNLYTPVMVDKYPGIPKHKIPEMTISLKDFIRFFKEHEKDLVIDEI